MCLAKGLPQIYRDVSGALTPPPPPPPGSSGQQASTGQQNNTADQAINTFIQTAAKVPTYVYVAGGIAAAGALALLLMPRRSAA